MDALPAWTLAMAPVLVLAVVAAALVVQALVRPSRGLGGGLAIGGGIAAFAVTPTMLYGGPGFVGTAWWIDGIALLATATVILCAIFVAIIALFHESHRWTFAGVGLAALGAALLAVTCHLGTSILGLEAIALGAGLSLGTGAARYAVPSAIGTALVLAGGALVYAGTGHLDFPGITLADPSSTPLLAPGLGLVLAGAAWKLVMVPSNAWIGDLWTGAPRPARLLLGTVVRVAGTVLAARLLAPLVDKEIFGVGTALTLIVLLALLAGPVLALDEPKLARAAGFRSTTHIGWILACLLPGSRGVEAALIVAIAGAASTLLASAGPDEADDLPGFAVERPAAGALLAAGLASEVGLPFTVGFVARLSALGVIVASGRWAVAVALGASFVLGSFVIPRLLHPALQPADDAVRPGSPWLLAVLAVLALAVLLAGVYPTPLLALVHGAVAEDFLAPLQLLP